MALREAPTDALALHPPKMDMLGTIAFASEDRATLSAWLAQDGWPRGRMDIIMLEGYLIALLAWPVRANPGVWLPPIWGQMGWKVPAKIDSPSAYRKFIELVVGFAGHLDRGLSASPPHFKPDFPALNPGPPRETAPEASWAQGFLKGLQLSAEGFGFRSDSIRSAVLRIARYASSVATVPTVDVTREITSGVLTLAAERSSRGPLGPFLDATRARSLNIPQKNSERH